MWVTHAACEHGGVDLVRASGCVVWRASDGGPLEFLVIHRPRYDDWSFPKGKLDPGETDEECALRELAEETGVGGELGVELTPVEYVDHKGRPKLVRYWMVAVDSSDTTVDHFEANDEVDVLGWMNATDTATKLSYDRDRMLLAEALEHLG